MKILICTDALGYGGAETHVISLAGALDAMGHNVTVAAEHGELESQLADSVTFFPLPAFRGRSRTALGLLCPIGLIRLLRIRRRLASLARRDFDVIHAHARLPALLLCGIARRRHIPLVVTAHAMFRMTPLRRRLSRWGDRTIAVSEDIKQLLVSHGIWADNITVISNGIDTDRFRPADERIGELCSVEVAFSDEISTPTEADEQLIPGTPAEVGEATSSPDYPSHPSDATASDTALRIIFVSRLDRDCSSAATALCRLAGRLRGEFPGLTITLVGGGDCYGELSALAELMNTACGDTVVRLTGARNDVEALLRRADIFVGVSRAAMEAAACGLPVILAGDEGYGGIFIPGDTTDPTNLCARGSSGLPVEALFGDICRLARLPAYRRHLGNASREFILRHYSAAASAERTVELYRKVAALFAQGQPRAVICGGAGYGDAGRDAALDVLIERLRSKGLKPSELCLITKDPRRARARFGIRCVGRWNCAQIRAALVASRLLVLGGGSLIQGGVGLVADGVGRGFFGHVLGRASRFDRLEYYRRLATRAQRLGCGIMLWGAGLGPLYGDAARRQTALLCAGARLMLLREPLALDIAHALGLRPDGGTAYADPALLTQPCERERAAMLLEDANYFAVSLRPPRRSEGVGQGGDGLGYRLGLAASAYAREEEHRQMRLAAALDGISQVCGAEAIFFIMSPEDRAFTESVRRHMKHAGHLLDRLTPGEMTALLGRCRVTVSMRLTLLALSFVAGVPAISIGNTPEMLGFTTYASLPPPLSAKLITPAQLVSLAAEAAHAARPDAERRAELLELADAGVERAARCICKCADKI